MSCMTSAYAGYSLVAAGLAPDLFVAFNAMRVLRACAVGVGTTGWAMVGVCGQQEQLAQSKVAPLAEPCAGTSTPAPLPLLHTFPLDWAQKPVSTGVLG